MGSESLHFEQGPRDAHLRTTLCHRAWKTLERPEEVGPGCPCPERAVGAVKAAAIQGQAPRTPGISLVATSDLDAVGVKAYERPRTLSRGH